MTTFAFRAVNPEVIVSTFHNYKYIDGPGAGALVTSIIFHSTTVIVSINPVRQVKKIGNTNIGFTGAVPYQQRLLISVGQQ
jgi:hypothetical protein